MSTTTTTTTTAPSIATTKLTTNPSTTDHDEEEEDIYDEIEIEDMIYDSTLQIYHYPCPCGDRFEINIDSLRDGEEIAVCPSCSLRIRVVFEVGDLPEKKEGEEAGKKGESVVGTA